MLHITIVVTSVNTYISILDIQFSANMKIFAAFYIHDFFNDILILNVHFKFLHFFIILFFIIQQKIVFFLVLLFIYSKIQTRNSTFRMKHKEMAIAPSMVSILKCSKIFVFAEN